MSKYFVFVVMASLLLIGFLTMFFSKEHYRILPIEETTQPQSNEIISVDNWIDYTSPAGDFTVMLPAFPEYASDSVKDPETKQLKTYEMYVSQRGDQDIYMISRISYSEIPTETEKERLMRVKMNEMISSKADNELETMKSEHFIGFPSLYFSYKNNNQIVNARMLFADNHLYTLSRIANKESPNMQEFSFFINSFTLTGIQ